ncbi:unnamed protein product [Schistosoma mattheei]|uniref:Uncharacterized protein n=1 Tax=Schistosoma mattheei TaxID=31246 RepID=A0AA85ASI2_9TREM|nr:unnamed protein product [Schistosoma mattheei]
MVPPSFSDLGKDARDLLFKKFYFGLYNIHCTTKKMTSNLKPILVMDLNQIRCISTCRKSSRFHNMV